MTDHPSQRLKKTHLLVEAQREVCTKIEDVLAAMPVSHPSRPALFKQWQAHNEAFEKFERWVPSEPQAKRPRTGVAEITSSGADKPRQSHPLAASKPVQHVLRTILADWGTDEEHHILLGFFSALQLPSRRGLYWLLRHFAARASALDSNACFARTLRLASAFGVSFATIMEGRERFDGSALLPRMKTPVPKSVLNIIERRIASSGAYCLIRRCNPQLDGNMCIWASRLFQ